MVHLMAVLELSTSSHQPIITAKFSQCLDYSCLLLLTINYVLALRAHPCWCLNVTWERNPQNALKNQHLNIYNSMTSWQTADPEMQLKAAELNRPWCDIVSSAAVFKVKNEVLSLNSWKSFNLMTLLKVLFICVCLRTSSFFLLYRSAQDFHSTFKK